LGHCPLLAGQSSCGGIKRESHNFETKTDPFNI